MTTENTQNEDNAITFNLWVICRFLFSWKMLFYLILGTVLAIIDIAWVNNYWHTVVCFWIGWYGSMVWDGIWKIKYDR